MDNRFDVKYVFEQFSKSGLKNDRIFEAGRFAKLIMRKGRKVIQVSIVVTVKNENQSIESLLDSLEHQIVVPKEIIFVDGGSVDGTINIIKERMTENKRIKLIIRKEISIAEGRNEGVLNSSGDIITMTDAGCVADKDWLLNITKPFLTNPKIGIVAGLYKMGGESLFQEAVKPYLGVPHRLATSSNFLPSARSMAFRKSVWEKIGGFSEDLERTGEDTLFNYQAKRKGIKFHFAENAVVNWEVPQNPTGAIKKFYYYAKGDAQTGIWWHPEKKLMTHNIKILAIYFRYFAGLLFLVLALARPIFFKIFLLSLFLYITWAILKNYYRVEKKLAVALSPFVQVISDIAVMFGFASGILSKL